MGSSQPAGGSSPVRRRLARDDRGPLLAHVPGAVAIPTVELASRLDEIDRSKTQQVIGGSGGQSAAMTAFLTPYGLDPYSPAVPVSGPPIAASSTNGNAEGN